MTRTSFKEILEIYRKRPLKWATLPTEAELLEIQQHNHVFDWDDLGNHPEATPAPKQPWYKRLWRRQ